MLNFTLTTDSDNLFLPNKNSLIDLANIELKEDIEANDGLDSLPEGYPSSIETFDDALDYLETYFSDRYTNISSLRETTPVIAKNLNLSIVTNIKIIDFLRKFSDIEDKYGLKILHSQKNSLSIEILDNYTSSKNDSLIIAMTSANQVDINQVCEFINSIEISIDNNVDSIVLHNLV